MLIGVDVDGVVADIHTPGVEAVADRLGIRLGIDDITRWDFPDHTSWGQSVLDLWHTPGFYGNVQPIEGALDGVRALRAAGHRCVFATACAPGLADEKAAWLHRHGFLATGRMDDPDFIAVSDKTLVRGLWLVDDSPGNIRSWVESGRPAIVFDRPWNRVLDIRSVLAPWLRRALHWDDVVAVVTGNQKRRQQ